MTSKTSPKRELTLSKRSIAPATVASATEPCRHQALRFFDGHGGLYLGCANPSCNRVYVASTVTSKGALLAPTTDYSARSEFFTSNDERRDPFHVPRTESPRYVEKEHSKNR